MLQNIAFNDIVTILPEITKKDSHLIPQNFLLKWHFGIFKSNLKIDRILKMENDKDLFFMSNNLNIDTSKKHNKSNFDKDLSITMESNKIIREVYKGDYEIFKYK